jgi:hypothetical protein
MTGSSLARVAVKVILRTRALLGRGAFGLWHVYSSRLRCSIKCTLGSGIGGENTLNENIKSADQNRHKRDVAVYCLEMDEKNSSGWEAVLAKKKLQYEGFPCGHPP